MKITFYVSNKKSSISAPNFPFQGFSKDVAMALLDGRILAQKMRKKIKKEIHGLGISPGLGVILVGDNPASHLYVQVKERRCREVGIWFEKYLYESDTTQEKILTKIKELNERKDIDGILIQLPLPAGFDTKKIIASMDSKKDVDGFHPKNIQNVIQGTTALLPVLVKAILALLRSTEEPLQGKQGVIIAKSSVFTQPVAAVLTREGISVKEVKPDEQFFTQNTLEADILIVALGRPGSITGSMVKPRAIVIDIGTTIQNGKVIGDVDFASVKEKAAWITPVPGGVGPMTVACLLENVLECHHNLHIKKRDSMDRASKRT